MHLPVVKLKDAQAVHANGDFGHITMQECSNSFTLIRLQSIQWNGPQRLRFQIVDQGLFLRFILSHEIHQVIKGCGEQILHPKRFSALLTAEWTGFFEPALNHTTTILDIVYTPIFLAYLSSELLSRYRSVHLTIPTLLADPYRMPTPEIASYINHIVRNTQLASDHPGADFTHLFSLLQQPLQDPLLPLGASDSAYRSQLIRMIEHIDNNLSTEQNFEQLAPMFGIPPNRLKTLFPIAVGRTLKSYLQYKRNLRARDYILQSADPLKAIFPMAGYSSLGSFITGFTEALGCSPGELKRNKWNLDK